MGHLLHSIRDHQPLDQAHAAALAHYVPMAAQAEAAAKPKRAAKPITHTFTLRPTVLPRPGSIVSVTLEGATHTVALDSDTDTRDVWIDSVLVGGKWHSACDTFRDDFVRALERQVREDFAYEADAQCGVPE